MSQSVDQQVHKSLPKSVTKTTNKRKRSPTILKSTQQSIPRKKPKTSNVSNPRARSQTPHNKAHSNGSTAIKTKSNGTNSAKPHSILRPPANHTTNNKQQIQSKIDSIDKQKKQLMDPNNSIASTFKGMWKSRHPPQHLLQSTSNTKATKAIHDTNRGLKRRASGPPSQPPPAAKRQKIAPKKSQSQDALNHNKATKKSTRDEPPPLVTLNELNLDNTQKLSDYRLGIKPTTHCLKKEGLHLNPYQTNVLYETALSHIANDELQHGIYHQDLDSMIHQHQTLKHKLKRLRDDLGTRIPQQQEPIPRESPWDCLLDEVTHVAKNIKSNKLQRRLRCKLLSTAIRHKFEKEGLHKELFNKYQERTRQIEHQIDDRFEMKTKNAGNKVFRRSPNIAIAKAVKTFWNHTFQQWNALKQDKIATECVALQPVTFLDGVMNLNLDGNDLVDPLLLESIHKDYDLNNATTIGKASDIKRAVLLKCRSALLQAVPETKPIKIRGGKLKCKLRDYQFVGLNWLISLYRNKSNGILADAAGSGKTAQIIALFAWLNTDQKIAGPHLIIAPGSKIVSWQNQFKSHYPQCKLLVFEEGIKVEHDAKAKNNAWNVCLVSYASVVRYSMQFSSVQWKYIVMDEAEKVDDFSSPKWCSLFRLSVQFRILLADDAALNAMQLWSMLFCLAPNAFASKQEFVAWLESSLYVANNNARNTDYLDKLQDVLSPFMLKRSRSDMRALPEIIEKQYLCTLTPRQQQLYDEYIAQHGQHSWEAIYQLQQICNHPNLHQQCAKPEQLFEFDPISQLDYVRIAASDVAQGVKVVSHSDKSEMKRIEQLYEPLFAKVRDAVTKIIKEEKANKMDENEDSEDAEDDDSCCVTMTNPKLPSDALRKAISMALESIIDQKKNEMDQDSAKEDELLPLHIGLFSQCLSRFCAQGLCQWNCSKLNALAELLDDLYSARRHRVVLFASSERMLDILESFVLVYQYQYVRCGFTESKASSIALINKFENDRDAFIFIMSTRNIHCRQWDQTKADTVIFYDHEWDSLVQDNINKFMKTVHGGHSLTVYRLINQNTVEHEVFQHFKSNVSQFSVARYYSDSRNVSVYGFNTITAHIETAVRRLSLRTFYDEHSKYNQEFVSDDIGAESEQYIAFVKEQLLMKEPNNKLLLKLFDTVGFKPFVHGNQIRFQYKTITNKLKYVRQCYSEGANQLRIYYASYRNRGRANMKCAHMHSKRTFIDFNDASNDNKNDDDDVQILEKKPKSKSDKMEMSEDEDDDIKCLDPSPVSPPTKKKNKKGDPYNVSSEIRDTIYVCDENGEYYHHLYEPYVPYGVVINNCKMDPHLSHAFHQSLKETHDPNNYPLYLEYDYNDIQHNEENVEEKAVSLTENNETESMIGKMQLMFERWKDQNNEMYRLNGIVPGYLDKENQIQICPIDPKTKEIIYGSLDEFVRNVGSAHVWRLYQREKLQQPKEKSISIDSNANSQATDSTNNTSAVAAVAAPIKPTAIKAVITKPKRFKLKLNNTQKSLSSEFEDKLRLNDDYYHYVDNNVLSRLEDEECVIRSPDYEIPLKIYEDETRMTAFDFEIFKIKQEYKCGASNKNLKQIIDDFKFTPKPQVIHYQDAAASPSPMHDGDAYRLSDAEETSDSEATDKDSVSNVHASSASSSPMPSHEKIILESSPSSSANITTLSPNTQRKTDLLNSLRVPHNRKNTNNYNVNTQSDKSRDIKANNDDDHVTLSAIHRWIGVRNDANLPQQKTPMKPFKIEPKKDPKTGATRYDPKFHPTIFSSKEISHLHQIVNSFAAKTKGRRRISWRMVKQTLKTKQSINMRCRTRFELLRVYSKTARQCKRKDFESSLSYFGTNETVDLRVKKQKKSKRTAFWDARFTELQEKKGRGNKKLFKEPLDFDDKKLNAITKKMTKRMVKELDVCISRVVDLTPDNQNKDEHASHQQTIKAAYQKLNLIVQGQKPYAPNYIWKNHWGQLPVNPYTKPNISHPQQAPIHPSMNPSSHQSLTHVPHHSLVRPPMPPHASSTAHPSSYMATHAANPNIPPGHRPSYHPGYYSMRAPHHVPSHHVPSLHPSHIPPSGSHPPPIPGAHNTHSIPPYAHHASSAAHPLRTNRPVYSMPPYAPYQSSYPSHPNAAAASRAQGPTRVQHAYHPPYPYMSSAGMNPALARSAVHTSAPPTVARPRYGTPMGAATVAPQQHPSYTANNRNTQNTNNAPPARPNSNNNNTNNRQSAPNPAVQRTPNNPTTANSMPNSANTNSNNPNSARMANANSFRRAPPAYNTAASRVGASLAGSAASASYTAQQRQHMMRQRQYAQRSANNNASKSNPNTPIQATTNSNLNNVNPAYRNRNGPNNATSNANNSGQTPRNLSQPPRLEQHTTTNNMNSNRRAANNANAMNQNNAKSQYINSPRPSLSGTINHDSNNRNAASSASKSLAPLHASPLFKNRSKQFMDGNKKQAPKQHANTQQNPFGSPNTKSTSAALGLPSIADNNTNNGSNHASDRDVSSNNDADREARNGFVSMPNMGSVPTMNQPMNTSALPPRNLLIDGQMQRDFNNANYYTNHPSTAVQSNSNPNACPISTISTVSNPSPSRSRSTRSHSHSNPSVSSPSMLTRNFHRHRTNHNKAQKHTVVTNGNGRSVIKPSHLPRSNNNNPPQTSSSSVVSNISGAAPTVISTASSNHTDSNNNNSNNNNNNNRSYYNHPSQPQHPMMNGHTVSVRPRNQQFVNSNNQYTQQRPQPPQQQPYRGMQAQYRPNSGAYPPNNVNNINRGMPPR